MFLMLCLPSSYGKPTEMTKVFNVSNLSTKIEQKKLKDQSVI
jgi:hypothetical protein